MKLNRIRGKEAEKLMEESKEAKEKVIEFRERKDEIVASPIYKNAYRNLGK